MCSPIRAQEPAKSVAAKLEEICTKSDLPGMSVAVVNTEGLVQSQSYGVRKRQTTDNIDATDRFPIASNTKSMTAVMAAALVEAGKIQWKTSIGEVWPGAKDKDIHPSLRKVTLDQLLSHQSGLTKDIADISKEAWREFFQEKESPLQARRKMLKMVLSQPPSAPQDKFSYSNVGYAVAAAMLEARAGESFESLMKKTLFDPLEMRSADFRTMDSAGKLKSPLLWGHERDGKPIDPRSMMAENPAVYAACGTVHLTIEDYAKYARWQLAGKPAPVLRTQAAFDHLRESQVDYTAPGSRYACGWICVDTPLGPAFTHSGSNTNTFALIWVIPDANFAGIVCTNSGQSQAFTACDQMMTFMIGKFAAKKNEPVTPMPKDVSPKQLVGRYQLTPSFVFDVKVKGDHLAVGITNQPTQEVFAESPTMWAYRTVQAKLEFHIGADGRATALTLHQNGLAQKAKRLKD
ncbi:MAG: serine hydrolase [Pirellulales bacterium]